MSTTTIDKPADERTLRRLIGIYDSGVAGPTVLVQGGIHGNEPGGVRALERILATLSADGTQVTGRLVAVAGNLSALAAGTRFVDRDLNRLWLRQTVDSLLEQKPGLDCNEDREQRELIEIYEKLRAESRGPLILIDLHSSSAAGAPFTCLADTLANRRIAMAAPIPLILGLEEAIDGAVMDWFTTRGHVSLAVEGGQHDAPSTVDNLEAATWLFLTATGLLRPEQVDLEAHRATLRRAAADLPAVVEIIHRQVLQPGDGFRMDPGFESFQTVQKGQSLARDRNGPIPSPEKGRMLLPLYQGQGDDGFFLCRDVKPFWLVVARWLRNAKLDRIAHWLPGVRRDAEDRNRLIVNPRIARWFVVEIFHLLGFRRRRTIGGQLTFTRRWTEAEAKRRYAR